jgi:antitoxin CptB|tara:strand:+ start:3394 stop:3663 length:270 start_codon:yes stop_codon:yes gene_type:complete
MNINIENLKKKIIYRSQYRGTKEMDKLLGAFVAKYIKLFNEPQLLKLENFLNLDDENLYKIYNGLKTEVLIDHDNEIMILFKKFIYKVK